MGAINLKHYKFDDIASLSKEIQKEWMKENYSLFNSLYFNDELPDIDEIDLVPIKRKDRVALGTAYNKYPYKIRLNFRYHLVEIEWFNVLLHEMIHIWEYINGYAGGHGKIFKQKAKEINEYGFGITTTYKNIITNLNEYDEFENR